MGRVGVAPSPYTGPTGGALTQAMQQSIAASEQPVSMRPQEAPPVEVKSPARPSSGGDDLKPIETADTAKPQAAEDVKPVPAPPTPTPLTPPTPPTPPTVVASAAPAAPSVPPSKQPGLPFRSADPAPKSDSEIDAFSKVGSAEIRAGRMTVRSGRKHKLTRPKITLAGFWDGVALGKAVVTLKLSTDPTGQVIRATVLRSSGSAEIDNPVMIEAYNWWFEPDKNADGQPIATEFPFTVVLFR